MIPQPQRAALAIGKTGCYFLSICKIAELVSLVSVDPLDEYLHAVAAKSLGVDCMVNDAGALLSGILRGPWACLKAGPDHELPLEYRCAPREYEVLRYERDVEPGDTSATERAHFVLGDGSGIIFWDPYGESHTVAVGRVVSKRIFRRA